MLLVYSHGESSMNVSCQGRGKKKRKKETLSLGYRHRDENKPLGKSGLFRRRKPSQVSSFIMHTVLRTALLLRSADSHRFGASAGA